LTSRLLLAAVACLAIASVGVDSARAIDRMSYVRQASAPSSVVELWTADLDGSNRERWGVYRLPLGGCTPDYVGPCPIADTAVAPDGDTVAYETYEPDISAIGLVSSDCASSLVYLHANPYHMEGGVKVSASYVQPGLAWAPDGSKLYFTTILSYEKPPVIPPLVDIHSYSLLTGREEVVIAWPSAQRNPSISADGSTLAFESPNDAAGNAVNGIWAANADGSDARLLVPRTDPLLRWHDAAGPAISPDGERVVFRAFDSSPMAGLSRGALRGRCLLRRCADDHALDAGHGEQQRRQHGS
jgi:WD40 repeat protein